MIERGEFGISAIQLCSWHWGLNTTAVGEDVTFPPRKRLSLWKWRSTNSQVNLGWYYHYYFYPKCIWWLTISGECCTQAGESWVWVGVGGQYRLLFQYKSLNRHSSVVWFIPTWCFVEVNEAKLLSSRGRDQHGESFIYIYIHTVLMRWHN